MLYNYLTNKSDLKMVGFKFNIKWRELKKLLKEFFCRKTNKTSCAMRYEIINMSAEKICIMHIA